MSDIINLEIIESEKKIKEEKYFKRDRYIKEDILAKFEKIETINKIMNLDISFNDAIEIYLDDKQVISRDLIKEILAEILMFDNYVQDFCELNYKKSSFRAENYIVALSWVSIEQNKVVMRYWGEYVNIELEAVFVKNNFVWENKDIYYC